MKHTIQALAHGAFRRTVKPGLVKSVRLENYLKHCPNQGLLARAIAYSITNPLPRRCAKEWIIFKNSCALKDSEMKNIAVFSLSSIESLKDLISVDYSILLVQGEEYETLMQRYQGFKKLLLSELRV